MSKLIKLINIPKITDDCFLYFAQTPEQIPFKIARIYLIKDSNTKLSRGHHAHLQNKQVLFCISGSIKMVLDDGKNREKIYLDKPEKGIFLDRLIWHEMQDFQKDTILLILASEKYDSKDYIRDYKKFIEKVKKIN